MAPEDGRFESVDHLRGAGWPGHRQLLQLARLAETGGAVLVVPGIRFRGRHTVGRPHDHHSVWRQIDQRVDLLAAAKTERGASRQEEWHVGANARRELA